MKVTYPFGDNYGDKINNEKRSILFSLQGHSDILSYFMRLRNVIFICYNRGGYNAPYLTLFKNSPDLHLHK